MNFPKVELSEYYIKVNGEYVTNDQVCIVWLSIIMMLLIIKIFVVN